MNFRQNKILSYISSLLDAELSLKKFDHKQVASVADALRDLFAHSRHQGDRNSYNPLSDIHSYFHTQEIIYLDEMDQKKKVSLASLFSSNKQLNKAQLEAFHSLLQKELETGGTLYSKLKLLKDQWPE